MLEFMTVDQVDQVLIWVVLAFALWLALSDFIRRLQVPNPVLVAAPLSWLVARLFIWALPILLHEIETWSMR